MTRDVGADARLAVDLVREAGRLASRMRAAGDLSVTHKTSVSDVVTAADTAAEALVVDRLVAERPQDGLVGEEGSRRGSTSGRTWHVDPVDGTYNFAAGLTWWCSAVALVEERDGRTEVLLGAVYHPREDMVFVGGPDWPTTRDGIRLPPLEDQPLSTACLTTYLHPPYYATEVGAAFARAVSGAAAVRMLGSGSMDQTAVAQGQLGVLAQHSVASWDWWPGAALVLGVGGSAVHVRAAGVEWSVSGAPTAVTDVVTALGDR